MAALPAGAATGSDDTTSLAAQGSEQGGPHPGTGRALDAIVTEGTPGVLARVDDAAGPWRGSAGVADREMGRPRWAQDTSLITNPRKSSLCSGN
ncbi:hypothetical protein [Streptomyces zagrosensis]|uniref:Uncharacterized protein n=1 Tax=Streptomyces zagrosensis TaxID=1042984 RepID=A0A7W9Q969_9ACTN|nr:hypothetical protein [Streptomyces zagrosensis]MBB5935930.1 hypothetical protein [Streptomyces zagrosensis]